MDKLKSMMSGNKDKDSDFGDTSTSDISNKNTVSGQGSHFGSVPTTGTDPLSSSTNHTSATGSNLGGTGTHGPSEPHSSRMPGSFDDDADTTASVASGIPGRAQTGNTVGSGAYSSGVDNNKPLPTQPGTSGSGLTGPGLTDSGMSSNTAAGPYSPNPENKLDPRVDSDLDGRSGLGNTNTGTGRGMTGNTSSGLGSNTADTGVVGAGTDSSSNIDSGRSFPLGGTTTGSNTGYSAPGQIGIYPAGGAGIGRTVPNSSMTGTDSGMTGTGNGMTGTSGGLGSNNTAGPHPSSLENKLDPRVDPGLDGRGGLHNAATDTTSAGYGSGTAPITTSGHSGTLGRDAALGADAGATAGGSRSGYGADSWGYQHGGHSHKYKGDPCGPESAVSGAPHFTTGPHGTDTANRLDPHIGSGVGAPGSTTGTSAGSGVGSSSTGTGLGSSTTGSGTGLKSSTTGTAHHTGRDAALGAGAGAAGVGAYEAGRDQPQSTATGPAPNTAGPHKSDMLNKLDPRVDSDLSKQQPGNTSTGIGSNTAGTSSGLDSSTAGKSSDPYDSSTTRTGHHTGRDAALTGSAGTAGLGAYEAEKHHQAKHDPTGTTNTSDLGSSTTTGAPHHSHHQGHHDRQQHAAEHHLGRDAGLAGAGTAAGYEAERHHGHPTQSSTVPSTTSSMTTGSRVPTGSGYDNQTGTGHHYGRDAGLVGAGGVGAYEAEKRLGHYDTAGERLAGSGHQPNTATPSTKTTGTANDPAVGGMQSATTGTGHHDQHLGRDTALGAGVGGAAYEAKKHHHNKQDLTSTTGITSSQDPQHHYGRDAALGAGVAGAGYEADKHHRNEEAKKLEHEREKEAKHQDSGKKSGGIMGLFHRDKGDKEAKKEERAEEKAEQKAEHGHHTGRDAALGAGAAGTAYEADKSRHTHDPGDEEMAAGAGAIGLESDMKNTNLDGKHHHLGEGHAMAGSGDQMHGSQAGVHDSAISSGSGVAGISGGPTTHDAYGEQDPNRVNRLHKDPPAGRGL